MIIPDQHPVLLTSEEAIDELLELVTRHRRAGLVPRFDIHTEEGLATVSIRYAPGAPPIELRTPAHREDDESPTFDLSDLRDTIPDDPRGR